MSRLPWLNDADVAFPSVSGALQDPDGLLAVGGDLSPRRLLKAYQEGIFPWYQDDQPILWWSPSVRMVLLPEDLRISTSMRKLLRKKTFRITLDCDFPSVIGECAAVRESRQGTWITPQMRAAYCRLHELGYAHSVEVWSGKELAGGLYGIAMGKAFFGESMFSLHDNASKTALVWLTRQLQTWGYRMIDCQIPSDHLRSLGAREMDRNVFLGLLKEYRDGKGRMGKWRMELTDGEL